MWQYVLAGLVYGRIYAVAASGLVLTYVSAGILNFAFGAMAFFVARFYFYLNSQEHWPIAPAAVVAIGGAGPLLGVVLYYGLFRFLQESSALIKIVATVGMSVAIPYIANLLFGDKTILQAPGLAGEPSHVFQVIGVAVTVDQLVVYGLLVSVVVVGVIVFRYTAAGLRIRAMVDSPALTSLSGTNPSAVSLAVWATSGGWRDWSGWSPRRSWDWGRATTRC